MSISAPGGSGGLSQVQRPNLQQGALVSSPSAATPPVLPPGAPAGSPLFPSSRSDDHAAFKLASDLSAYLVGLRSTEGAFSSSAHPAVVALQRYAAQAGNADTAPPATALSASA